MAAMAQLGGHQQAAAMPVENVFDNRQAKPGSAARPALLHADAVETFREAWNMFFGNAASLVDHRQGNEPGLGFRLQSLRFCRAPNI